jgi:hypothetical protein
LRRREKRASKTTPGISIGAISGRQIFKLAARAVAGLLHCWDVNGIPPGPQRVGFARWGERSSPAQFNDKAERRSVPRLFLLLPMHAEFLRLPKFAAER